MDAPNLADSGKTEHHRASRIGSNTGGFSFSPRRWLIGFLLGVLHCYSSLQVTGAQSVTLAWDSNAETNLAGYRLYYGTTPRNYSAHVQVAKPNTDATVNGLQAGQTYFFAVTAYTHDGLESDYSDEVPYTVPAGGEDLEPKVELTESVVSPVPAPWLSPYPPADTIEIVHIGEDPGGAFDPGGEVEFPTEAAPRLEIEALGQPPVAFLLRFDAPPNRRCELQISEDFLNWHQLVPFTTGSTGGRYELTDLYLGDARRYYRLRFE
jgi:hypothetical protein